MTHRFVKYFVVGCFLEAARLLSFHFFFEPVGSLGSNLYSLIVSLVVSFPVLARFVWPDRAGSWREQATKFVAVWLIALVVKLPLLEVVVGPCVTLQPTIGVWLFRFPQLASLGLFYGMIFSCVNLTTALMDLVVAVGLKYVLYDRLVFTIRD